jgi:hypothetical protein
LIRVVERQPALLDLETTLLGDLADGLHTHAVEQLAPRRTHETAATKPSN